MRHLIFFLFFSPFLIHAQGSKHVVIDKLTSEPIPNVHIIVTNSSLSTYSDQNGIFTLDSKSISGLDIIMSHISYELITIAMPLGYTLPDKVEMVAMAVEVADVQIVAKKNNLKKKRINQFKKDLFTSDDPKVNYYWKKCNINNPESILFLSKADTMLAESSRLISINNPYLGYELTFLLEDYYSTKGESAFTGKLMFSELAQQKTSKKIINKRRLEKHALSQAAFFADLLSHTEKEGKFNCYIKDPLNGENKYIPYLQGELRQEYVKKTVIPGVYALLCPSDVYVVADDKQSIISTTHGLLLFNEKGVIMNKDEINIQGYWSRLSLSEQLPMDYKTFDYDSIPMIPFDKAYTILELRNYKVKEESEEELIRIQEIAVETDRLLYKRGEDLYVSGHIFNHDTKELIKEDQIITIDLINSKKEVVDSKKKLVKNGVFESGFEIIDTLEPGHYAIYVHSAFPASLASSKVVWINTIYTNLDLHQHQSDSAIVTFYPEGNKFIEGFINKVLIKIHDELGNKIPFKGSLKDNLCGNVIPVQTFSDGMAIVHLMSVEGCNYTLESKDNRKLSVNYEPLLPRQGASLNITVRNEDFFTLKILSNIDLKNHKIQVEFKGNIVYTLENLDTKNTYKLNKNLFQNGILDFQLTNNKGDIVSNRLVDHSKLPDDIINANMNYAYYNQKQEGRVKFKLRDTSLLNLTWNLRIVNSEYDPKATSTEDFEELASVLSEVNFEMLRNNKMIGERINKDYANQYDKAFNIRSLPTKQRLSGITYDVKNNQPVIAKVSISNLGEEFYYDETESTEDGKFTFENIPFVDAGEFVIQARKNVKRGQDITKGNRNVKIVMDSVIRNETFEIQFPEILEKADYSIDSFISARPSFSLNVDIDEVTVTAKKIDSRITKNLHNLNEMDWIRDENSGITLLARLHPSKRVKNDPFNPNQLLVWVKKGEPVGKFKTMIIIIDGQRQDNASTFLNMIADEISFIGLENEILTVVRTPDFQRRSTKRAQQYGIHNHVFKENIDKTDKEYVNTAKGIAPNEYDGRKTLLWQPGVRFEKIEKDVRFLTSQLAGTYLIEMSTVHPEYGYITFDWNFEVR